MSGIIRELPPCAHALCMMLRTFDPKRPYKLQSTKISEIDRELFELMTKHSLLHSIILCSLCIQWVVMVLFLTSSTSLSSLLLTVAFDATVNLLCVFFKFKFCRATYEASCQRRGCRLDSLCARLWDTVPARHQPKFMRSGIPEAVMDLVAMDALGNQQTEQRFETAACCMDLVVNGFVDRQWEKLEDALPTPTPILSPSPLATYSMVSGERTSVLRAKSLRDTRMPADGVLEIIKTYCGSCRFDENENNFSSMVLGMMSGS